MKSEEERILHIRVKYEDAINSIAKYKESIDALKNAEKELGQQVKDGTITEKEYKTQVAAIGEQVKQYKENIRVLSKEIQNNLKQEKLQEGSLRSLRAELSNATKEYDSLSRAERNGAKGKELKNHINEITTELKKAEEETQRFYRNVGNYKQSILDAIAGTNGFAKSLLSLAGGSGGGAAAGGAAGGAAMGAAAVATAGIGALVAGIYTLKGVISSAKDLIISFEKENSTLAAVLGTTADKIQGLTEDAKRLGEQTRYTAVEVTQLQVELAKLGFSENQIKDSTEQVLMFANATGADLAEAANVAGAALRAFGDDAKNMGRYVSAMAVGTTKSALSFGDLSTTISTLAPVAHAFGFEIEDVVTLIGKLKDSGFDASSAATAARNILLNLADSNGKLAKSMGEPVHNMDELAKGLISLRDSGIDLAGALDLTDKRSVAAFESFMTNAEGLTKMRKSVTDCEDGLKQMNETMSNNVNGSLAKLESAWQGLLLKFYDSKGAMKIVIDAMTDFVSWCSKLGERFDDLKHRSLLVRASWNGFVAGLKMTLSALGNALKAIVDMVKGLGKAIEGLLTLDFSRMFEGLKQTTLAMPKFMYNQGKDSAKALMKAFKDTVSNDKVSVKVETETEETAGDGAETAKGAGSGKWKGVKDEKALAKAKAAQEKHDREMAEMRKKEQEEIQKAENLMMQLVVQTAEQKRLAVKKSYDHQIADLKLKLETDKKLTADAKVAINSQIESLEQIRDKKLEEFDRKRIDEEVSREEEYIRMRLSVVRKGSEEEFQLKAAQIENQRQLALSAAQQEIVSEEEKQRNLWAINEEYDHMYDELLNERTRRELEEIQKRYEQKILQAEVENGPDGELEVLRLRMEEKQAMLEAAQQMEGETIEEFNMRKLQMEQDFQKAKKALADGEVKVETGKAKAIASVYGGLSKVVGAFADENEELAKLSKVLALGEIAINTGTAIAKGVSQAQSVPYPANLAAIATTVATVLSNIATAISTVKSAKFATGGAVEGEGTETSDSIPAMLSNGESVLTAAATRMFAPALSAFNQMGGGVPITVQNNGTQMGEEFLANAVAKGMSMAPRPVVSVEEIRDVESRLDVIEDLSTI